MKGNRLMIAAADGDVPEEGMRLLTSDGVAAAEVFLSV